MSCGKMFTAVQIGYRPRNPYNAVITSRRQLGAYGLIGDFINKRLPLLIRPCQVSQKLTIQGQFAYSNKPIYSFCR